MTLKTLLGAGRILGCSALLVVPAGAQTPPPTQQNAPPALLQIEREEVRPGKGAAHAVNEAAWAAAYVKAESPVQWLGMTTLSGPGEAWFLTGHESFAALEKSEMSTEANAGLSAERDRLAGIDGDLLGRTSTIIARYRPGLSYQAAVSLPHMRYMTVDVVRVKSGRVAEFADAWAMIVEAHKKSNMDEHWAVYEVDSGMLDTTFLFMYARKSLAELDASGPMHGVAGYRDAVSDGGRRQMRDMNLNGVEMTQTLHFRLRPGMSALSQEWAKTDPFWAVPVAVTAERPTPKKK